MRGSQGNIKDKVMRPINRTKRCCSINTMQEKCNELDSLYQLNNNFNQSHERKISMHKET